MKKFNYLTCLLIVIAPLFIIVNRQNASDLPQRIISLAPHMTEIVFKLGANDRLIGRTEFCLYPAAAQNIPSVGGYLNPDYEKIVSLNPDLILMLPNEDMERKLNEIGLNTFSIWNETIEDIQQTILGIGNKLGLAERAGEIVWGIKDTLKLVQQFGAGKEDRETLFLVGREEGTLKGLYTAGKETYLSKIWSLCGGQNVYRDIEQKYFNVSKEDLIARNPHYILEFRIIPDEIVATNITKLKADWKLFSTLTAVQKQNIFIFHERYFLIPGPRISKIAIRFSQILNREPQ
jgi:iron complex transport system substrate-binding protein